MSVWKLYLGTSLIPVMGFLWNPACTFSHHCQGLNPHFYERNGVSTRFAQSERLIFTKKMLFQHCLGRANASFLREKWCYSKAWRDENLIFTMEMLFQQALIRLKPYLVSNFNRTCTRTALCRTAKHSHLRGIRAAAHAKHSFLRGIRPLIPAMHHVLRKNHVLKLA